MSLTLASLEAPDFITSPDNPIQYVAQFEELRDTTFENGEWVIVDNRHFYNCQFVRCHLVYAGGLFGFYNCEVGWEAVLSLTGAAKRGQVISDAFTRDMEDVPVPFRG
jgi:hypothetical protein